MKYAADVLSTLRYHFFKFSMPSVIASLTSRYLGFSAIDSQRLIRNSRDGMMRQTVGVRSFEKVCCTFAGSWVMQVNEGIFDQKKERTLKTS